jgi:tRNA-dihydrouridine synthase B
MLQNLPKMQRVTEEIVKRVHLPVTVKTRLGWDDSTINILEAAKRLQDIGVQALTIHARTRVQLYKGTANWDWIAKVKNLPEINIPIFGNGDVDSPEKALEYRNRYGVDGIMIGRGSIGNPWIFREVKHFMKTGEKLAAPTLEERASICIQHFVKSLEWKGPITGIIEMRRHYNNYFKGLPDFKPLRMKLVESLDAAEIMAVLDSIPVLYAGFVPMLEKEAILA